MKIDAKIMVCYNSPATVFSDYSGKSAGSVSAGKDLSETVFQKEIGRIKKSLRESFSHVTDYAVNGNVEELVKNISRYQPDIIFNFVESVEGIAQLEFCAASLYELLEIEFTGNGPIALGMCLNKTLTKNILNSTGVNTPDFITVNPGQLLTSEDFHLKFPVIMKLANEDASIGISEFSVVDGYEKLNSHLHFLFATYNQPVIIEEYIDGREFNVAILGDEVLPISEIEFHLPPELPRIVTYEGKWVEGTVYYNSTVPKCPAVLDNRLKKSIELLAYQAYKAMNCRDYTRVDVRIDSNKVPYVIEVNPNPDISMDSGFVRAASAAGISYSQLLSRIAGFALARKHYDTQVKAS
jgi:D-alanine-D-alanine ligase